MLGGALLVGLDGVTVGARRSALKQAGERCQPETQGAWPWS